MLQSDINSKDRAVALRYDVKDTAPVIVASGLGYMAQKIVDLAGENQIPVFEDTSLATLLSQLEVGSEIPEELYKAIVDIYIFLLSFKSTGSKQE
jgi:flagellar biosynthesis protein